MTKLSRRNFMAGSAAMGGMMFGMQAANAQQPKAPEKYDFEADVVVVGAGASGIPTAIRAAQAGLKTLIVDANYDIGGHAIISQGNTASKIARKLFSRIFATGQSFRPMDLQITASTTATSRT